MDSDSLYSDFRDEIANYEFQKLFYSKFENSNLIFFSDSLKHCLKQVIIERKPLIFFLHNDDDADSQKCCKLLNERDVEDFISTNFLIMGWKINNRNESYMADLANRILLLEGNVKEYVKNGIPCIFIIIPNINGVKIEQELKITKENTNTSDCLLSYLKKIQKLKSLYIKQEDFTNMTSFKYQQWMYDELGDRDYDSFDNYEHEELNKKLLFAMFGPQKEQSGYEEKQTKEIDCIYKQIRSKNNEFSKWNDRIVIAFIYNCLEPLPKEKNEKAKANKDYNHEYDFYPVPVFVLRKCKAKKGKMIPNPCRIFIDSNGRVYDSWTNYLEKNTLPPRRMIYPKDGKYQDHRDNANEVWLEYQYTPSCSKSAELLKVADIGSGITGFLSGAAMVASAFTPLAAVTIPYAIAAGITTGIYAAGRGTSTLIDRKKHEQNINITDSESRGAYLNIAAGTVGLVGAGATNLLTNFVRNGVQVGEGTLYAVNIINGANIAIAGTSTASGFYDVYQQWSEDGQMPSSLTLLQLGSSLFFFGNSVVNFRTAGTLMNEVQTSTLNELDQAIRSNRQRKSFNKLLKETTRLQGNTRGRAEVIATMRNSATRDEVLGVLTRSNKNFNKNGIRFSAEGGGIAFNGVPVDILEFGNMPKSQHSMYFETFPPIPENHTPAKLNYTRTIVENMQLNENLYNLFGSTDSMNTTSSIIRILTSFEQEVQQKIIKICEKFMRLVDVNHIMLLKKMLRSGDIRMRIIAYISDFIKKTAIEIQNVFESRLLNEDIISVCKEFGFPSAQLLTVDYVDYVIDKFTVNNDMMNTLIREFQTWLASLIYDAETKAERKEKRHEGPIKEKKNCPVCGGYYYEAVKNKAKI